MSDAYPYIDVQDMDSLSLVSEGVPAWFYYLLDSTDM